MVIADNTAIAVYREEIVGCDEEREWKVLRRGEIWSWSGVYRDTATKARYVGASLRLWATWVCRVSEMVTGFVGVSEIGNVE